jgi:diguanylate cyclase (GGDEF)-like protein
MNSNVQMILIDPSHQVIVMSDPTAKDDQQDYHWENNADIRKVSDTLFLWQPKSIPIFNSVARWSASEFVSIMPLERVPGYQLIIKEPVRSFQQSVFNMYMVSLSLAFSLIFTFALLALWATRKISSSLAELAEFSSGIPRKIRLRSAFEWKASRIYEVNRLTDNFRDMSTELVNMFQEVNDSQEKLRLLVHYDALTGLANRYSFSHYLPSLIQEAKEKGLPAACLFIDLDRFKWINDNMGHEAGDTVLKMVGERLNQFKGATSKPFRLAGDEFVVVLSAPLPEHIEDWAKLVRQALSSEEIKLDQQTIQLEFSAGLAIYPEHGQDAESLLRSADQAMYQAKVSGRNQTRMYKKS